MRPSKARDTLAFCLGVVLIGCLIQAAGAMKGDALGAKLLIQKAVENGAEEGNAAIADLETKIAELNAQNETDVAALAELEAQLAAEQEKVAGLTDELAAARAAYEARVAELENYDAYGNLLE